MSEIFETSEGGSGRKQECIYEPDCLIRGDEICIPTIGGEWIPSMRIDG